MNEFDPINQIDQIISHVKKHGDVSAWKKDRTTSPLLTVISKLNSMPKASISTSGLARVKNQVLKQVIEHKPELVEARTNFFFTITQILPRSLKITGGIIAGFMIFVSLGVGVSVAALDSVPGEPLYPVKKAVEKTQLSLANEERETELQIKFATNRLEELEEVLAQNQAGKISEKATQKIVSQTVKDLQANTNAAVAATKKAPSKKKDVSTLAKIAELGSKQEVVLETAAIETEGEIKLELEKALEISRISKEEAISNIERAGLKVEGQPLIVEEIPEDEIETKVETEPEVELK
jgi:hypothetical protein